MIADLVWLDRDIRSGPADRIADARIRGTWRRGIRTFRAVAATAAH